MIELLEKSITPERFPQLANASGPSAVNDIGAKVSTPVPLQEPKLFKPIDLRLEEKDATSLWQLLNANVPIDVRFWVLKIFCRLIAPSNALAGISVNPDTSNEPEMPFEFTNAFVPSEINFRLRDTNPPGILPPAAKNALLPILVRVEGRVPLRLEQLRNAFKPIVVNGIALKFVMVVRVERPSNAESLIVVIPGGNVREVILVHPVKADSGIVVNVELA